MKTTETPDASFLATAQRHAGGAILTEMSTALADVVRGVLQTAGKGSVTLKIDVAPAGRGKAALVVTHEVKAKVPVEKASGSIWFGTDAGELVRNDPNQNELRFTDEPVVVVGGLETTAEKPKAKAANE